MPVIIVSISSWHDFEYDVDLVNFNRERPDWMLSRKISRDGIQVIRYCFSTWWLLIDVLAELRCSYNARFTLRALYHNVSFMFLHQERISSCLLVFLWECYKTKKHEKEIHVYWLLHIPNITLHHVLAILTKPDKCTCLYSYILV